MDDFGTVIDVLDFAIEREKEAYLFYSALTAKSKRENQIKLFQLLADEEKKHIHRLEYILGLEAIKDGKFKTGHYNTLRLMLDKIRRQTNAKPNYLRKNNGELLKFAISTEDAAFKLYANMSEIAEDKKLKEIFDKLSAQELQHKRLLTFKLNSGKHQ